MEDAAAANRPKLGVFFELQGVLRSILSELSTVEKSVA